WVPIGKRNCYLDLKKSQGNPIYKIVVDLLKNTNFFRAFIAFSTIPSIYIQQFWDTVQYDKKAKSYKCQLDKQWFVLTKDTLREAFQITHRRHRFHPRPDSLLHLPNEEPVLGYLKFNAKGIKREVFEMPIPSSLITSDIQEASYYQEFLANVAKHRRYLAGETGSDQDSPAPKPAKPARKPKSTAPKARPRPSVSTLVTSAQPAPTSAPAKLQEKKHKQATETSDKPPKAKKSKYGFIGKKCSLKSVAAGPLPPVVIREPESGKYQPLPKVPGKGKAKVTEEQVAHDLLSLQKPKKKSPVDQYIFQRRTFTTTRSFRHDEPSYVELKQSEREESKKGVPGLMRQVKVQENLKLVVEEYVLLEDPASSSGTLSSLQHLSKDISFGNLFFSDKPSEVNNDKAIGETEVESMVSTRT
nr:E-beta-farnesene synthase [Tanacetum cinerariifolium]